MGKLNFPIHTKLKGPQMFSISASQVTANDKERGLQQDMILDLSSKQSCANYYNEQWATI